MYLCLVVYCSSMRRSCWENDNLFWMSIRIWFWGGVKSIVRAIIMCHSSLVERRRTGKWVQFADNAAFILTWMIQFVYHLDTHVGCYCCCCLLLKHYHHPLASSLPFSHTTFRLNAFSIVSGGISEERCKICGQKGFWRYVIIERSQD